MYPAYPTIGVIWEVESWFGEGACMMRGEKQLVHGGLTGSVVETKAVPHLQLSCRRGCSQSWFAGSYHQHEVIESQWTVKAPDAL
jgi:hypothetical protein